LPPPPRQNGRIPLPDLVRFKERQWFLEELEVGGRGGGGRGGRRAAPAATHQHDPRPPAPQNSRDGDPNAMLRLAKMYLHGQGCAPSAAMAQEWLRKARYLGVGASLDELYATEVRGGGGGGEGAGRATRGRRGAWRLAAGEGGGALAEAALTPARPRAPRPPPGP
jgi:TPR repeat protein